MALPEPVEREHIHTRQFEFRGYRRADGLFDIEGHLTDAKTYGFKNEWRGEIAAGEPVHDMWIRLTIDTDFLVHDIVALTEAGPYRICPDITPRFAAIKGQRIVSGWHVRTKELLGGVNGCTHLVEMLGAMGTVAYQTLWPFKAREPKAGEDPAAEQRRPRLLDSCHAYASDGEIAKRLWPRFYTGP